MILLLVKKIKTPTQNVRSIATIYNLFGIAELKVNSNRLVYRAVAENLKPP